MNKTLLPNGIMVIQGDSHLTKWVEESGRLDHDGMISTLAAMIPADTIAIDAGASIGDHTFGYLKSRAAMVVAFEPNPVAYECLIHNCPNAMCCNLALGAKPMMKALRINVPNYGASYIADDFEAHDFRVQVIPLDVLRFPQRVGFIKADIEGFESQFIMGARATIERDHPIMCLEVNKGMLEKNGSSPAMLLKMLDAYGYDTKPVPGTHEHPLQWDVLATPR